MSNLPYVYVDNELDLNAICLLLILNKLAFNSRRTPKLDFGKLQFFLYLIKNPIKINLILIKAEKNTGFIDELYTHTIDSLSNNVDILYDRSRLKVLIQRLASRQLVTVIKDKANCICYIPTVKGEKFTEDFHDYYFSLINKHIGYLTPLLGFTTTKLFSLLNSLTQES